VDVEPAAQRLPGGRRRPGRGVAGSRPPGGRHPGRMLFLKAAALQRRRRPSRPPAPPADI